MKAFKDSKGNVRMFRPDMNAKRLSYSMERMAMPPLDQSGFINCLKSLLKLDESWIPDQEGYSIYIRPTAIGISSFLGVQPPDQIKLYAIMSPVGPYFRSRFKPVKLLADTKYVRAWPGGVGNAKVGGNYGASLFPTREAVEKHNVSQILWLFGSEHLITEVGAMNIFFLLKTSTGVELVTPSLERGDILAGVFIIILITIIVISNMNTYDIYIYKSYSYIFIVSMITIAIMSYIHIHRCYSR